MPKPVMPAVFTVVGNRTWFHMPTLVILFVFEVLCNRPFRCMHFTCLSMWKRLCSKCLLIDCSGPNHIKSVPPTPCWKVCFNNFIVLYRFSWSHDVLTFYRFTTLRCAWGATTFWRFAIFAFYPARLCFGNTVSQNHAGRHHRSNTKGLAHQV